MNRRQFSLSLLAAALSPAAFADTNSETAGSSLIFDATRFSRKEIQANGQSMQIRVYEGLPTVSRPVAPEYQAINLYIPEAYFSGGSVGRFNAKNAPVFLPNAVGGYMPAKPGTLENRMPPAPAGMQQASAAPNASVMALMRGFIVAAPGARGRTLQDASGRWTGKAPAAIVDLKAAVRWLRFNAPRLPGNMERIISNGTSAGGALSALLGASGNHPAYTAELHALGAAPARDDIFAVSAYCPITNLPHADEAYEWQFAGLREYKNVAISMLDFRVQRKEVTGQLSDAQLMLAKEWRTQFADYVNHLGLQTPQGEPLALRPDGTGTLTSHITSLLQASAQHALLEGKSISANSWLTVKDLQVTAVRFTEYAQAVGRMKAFPAFDGLQLETGENQLFGDSYTDKRHFTRLTASHSTVSGAKLADPLTVKQMDAMQQLADTQSTVAPAWRIRHGTLDRDTSLAIPALLGAAARQRGAAVDLALAWDKPHSGDYDIAELFDWAESQVSAAT